MSSFEIVEKDEMVLKYDVLLFDLDDTLFDFKVTERNALTKSFQSVDLPNGYMDYIDSYQAISSVLWDDLEQGRITLSTLKVERFKRLFSANGLRFDAEVFAQTYLDNLGQEVHVMDDVEKMIDRVSNHRLAILTNGFKEAQHARISGSPLRDAFEAVITSEEAESQKPQRAIFDYTFEKLQITDKSRVLMVGDSLSSDIQGGNYYGIDTCWFNPAQLQNDSPIQPTIEIHSWNKFMVKNLHNMR